MPILPGLNDAPGMLDAVAARAAQAGASFIYGNVLFLSPSAMRQFMPFLEREFPHLVKRYRKLYARSAYLRGEYPEKIGKLMAQLRVQHGLEGNRGEVPAAARHPQMALPFNTPPEGGDATRLALTACHNGL